MNPAHKEIQKVVRPGKPTVLFVDDEKRVLNSMRAMFRRDYNLFLTTRGDEALKMIDENQIDVIVADQRMPIMTGVEVLSAVKKQSPDTVRILLTGYADLEAIEGAMNDGEVFRFLSKPCAAEELRGTIKLATEIANDTSGAAGTGLDDEEDDSLLAGMAASGLNNNLAQQLDVLSTGTDLDVSETNKQDGEIDDVIDFASTMVLSKTMAPTAPTLVAQDGERVNQAGSPQNQPGEAVEEGVEIVMSGDDHHVVGQNEPDPVDIGATTTVLHESPALLAPEPNVTASGGHQINVVGTGKYKVSVIVFSPDEQFAKSIGRSLQDYFYTFHATNVAHLMHGIAKVAPAVLITDISEDPEVIKQLAATLKQKVPEMVTMVASQYRDAELMVDLINHGQVFRFIDKPLSSTACKRHVREAIKKHIQLRDNPNLIKRHQVVSMKDNLKLPASIGKIFNGLGRVRSLWGKKAH